MRHTYWAPVKRVIRKQRLDGSWREAVVWVARYPDHDGKRKSAGTFRQKGQAAAAIREAMDAIWSSWEPPQSRARTATLRSYLPIWREDHPRSERSAVAYDSRFRQVVGIEIDGREFGDWDLRDVRVRQIEQLLGKLLAQGRAAKGAKSILGSLSALFNDAMHDDYCEINPCLGVRVRASDPRVVKRSQPRRIWTFAELHEFASCAGHNEAMLRIGIDCGLRLGELLALEREHWKPGFILVRQTAWRGQIIKNVVEDGERPVKNHDRDVPLPPSTERLLMKMPTRLGSRWLFPSPSGELWLEDSWRKAVMRPAVRAASEGRDRPLDPTMREIRRSYVSNLRAAGVDPADLADVTGHTLETANRSYTEPLRESYEAIRRAIG